VGRQECSGQTDANEKDRGTRVDQGVDWLGGTSQ